MQCDFHYFVVGTGSIGRRHATNLRSLGANVTAYSWREFDEETFLSKLKDYGERAAVIIATSTQIRLPLIQKSSIYGAALYIEKPLAYKEKDLEIIFGLPEYVTRRSMVGFMMRYHPLIKRALEIPLEKIFRAYFQVGSDVTNWRPNWDFDESYAANPDGGGVLLDLCHEIDIALLLCGSAEVISVRATSHPKVDGVDVACDVDFGDYEGLNFRVSMDYLSPSVIRTGSIVGIDGVLKYDLSEGELTHFTSETERKYVFNFDRNQMFLECMSDFMALVEGRPASNPHIPLLSDVRSVCLTVARAWERREFTDRLGWGHL